MPAATVVNAGKQSRTGMPRENCFPTNMTLDITD
jgi:hypothetical protein